jgi:multiple sugar transport system substrate-binding protein
MKLRRSGSLRNRHRGRAAGAGALSAAILAAGALATTPAAYASGSHITISVQGPAGPGTPFYQAWTWIFNQYHKTNPQVSFSLQPVTSNPLQKALSEATTHTLPDIFISDPTYLPSLMSTGDWVNLKPLLTKWGQMKDYQSATFPQATYKGGIYGIPDGLNTLAFIYNKKLFAEAGITTPPATWSQLLTDSKQLVTKVKGLTYGAVGFSAQTGCASTWQFLPWIYQQGLDVNNLTSPGMAAAVNYWNTLLKDGYANKEVLNECQNDITQVADGKLAMMEDGPFDLVTLAQEHFADWGTFPIPVRSASEHSAVPMGGEYWTVPKSNAAAQAAVEKFLIWSQQPKIELQYNLKEDFTPARPSLWPAFEKAVPGVAAFDQSLKYGIGRTTALGTKWEAYGTPLGDAIDKVLTGEQSTSTALAAAATAAKSTLASEGQ